MMWTAGPPSSISCKFRQPGAVVSGHSLKRILTFVLAIAAALMGARSANADDWPQWRGPQRDGVWRETGVLNELPAHGLKTLWRTPMGPGLSSPVVAQGRVFVTDVDTHSQAKRPLALERVRCLDVKTGQILWTYSYEAQYQDWAFDPKNPTGPNATPLVHDGKVYARGIAGELTCLSAMTGEVIWRRNTTADYGVAELSGTTPAPLIEKDLLIAVIGGKPDACVVAFDKDSGKERWRALSDRWTYSSPVVLSAGGKRQLIVWTPEAITSLDPATGLTLWRHALTTLYADATPVVSGDLLLVSGLMLRLDAHGAAPTALWQRRFSDTSVPLLQNGCVFADRGNGQLACYDATTGAPLWETDKVTAHRSGACIHFTPQDDGVYLFTEEGNLIRAKLTREGYRELWRTHVIDPSYPFGGRQVLWTSPAYADRRLWVRSERELICVSMEGPRLQD